MSTVRIQGLDFAAVFAVLYNAAKPQRMGFMDYKKGPMTVEEAAVLFHESPRKSFDYVYGRVMKITFDNLNDIEVSNYDRDNGPGAAQAAINAYRKTLDVANAEVLETHRSNTIAAGIDAKSALETDKTHAIPGGIYLGLDDVADALEPKIDKVLDEI